MVGAELVPGRSADVVRAEDTRSALKMRANGWTYAEIAESLSITPAQAKNYVRSALREAVQEAADEAISVELERLDAATRAIFPKVVSGDLQAVDALLKIQARRAKFLGLDAPTEFKAKVSAGREPFSGDLSKLSGPQAREYLRLQAKMTDDDAERGELEAMADALEGTEV